MNIKKLLDTKPSLQDIIIFFNKFLTLYSSGIPILHCLDLLLQSEKIIFKKIIISIKADITAGKSLSYSLRKFPNYFDELICNLIHAGEQTGTLATLLGKILFYLEKKARLKNQIKKILLYPLIVCSTSIIITLFMLFFVVPHFEEVFTSMHKQLPLFTLAVLDLSKCLRIYWYVWIIFSIAGMSFLYSYKEKLLKLPLLNQIVKKILISRFANNLAIIFASGVSIADALKLTATLCGNNSYKLSILKTRQQVIAGKQLNKALASQKIFSTLLVQMVKIGEECGTLVPMLEKTAAIYDAQLERITTELQQLLEPLIIIILGVLIGSLVVAMYLPIFKLGTLI